MNEKEKELRTIWNFIKDFWPLIKEYYPPAVDPDASYWPALIGTASSLGRKYGATRNGTRVQLIYYNLINALLDALEGRSYEQKSQV